MSQGPNIIIGDEVTLQMKIRGLAEKDVKRTVDEAVTNGVSEGDGRGRFLCKGSTAPGEYIFAYYKKQDNGDIVVVEVFGSGQKP